MPGPYSFSYFLGIDSAPDPATDSYPGATSLTWTLTDDQDSANDGSVANGDDFSFSNSGGGNGTATFLGLTPAGDPLVLVNFPGSSSDFYYILSNNGALSGTIGALDTTTALCFLTGTRILTPSGEVAVEALSIGDPVTTSGGRAVPVTWIGRQTVSTRFNVAERLRPVRVEAGALGSNLPVRDLLLTPDHALLIDGLLINAGTLVNGTTITHVPLSEFDGSYTVYHIETADHDVILAEGCPAETYIDYVGRQSFDNYAEYVALYGEDRVIRELDTPRISSARQLPETLRARLGLTRAA